MSGLCNRDKQMSSSCQMSVEFLAENDYWKYEESSCQTFVKFFTQSCLTHSFRRKNKVVWNEKLKWRGWR